MSTTFLAAVVKVGSSEDWCREREVFNERLSHLPQTSAVPPKIEASQSEKKGPATRLTLNT